MSAGMRVQIRLRAQRFHRLRQRFNRPRDFPQRLDTLQTGDVLSFGIPN